MNGVCYYSCDYCEGPIEDESLVYVDEDGFGLYHSSCIQKGTCILGWHDEFSELSLLPREIMTSILVVMAEV